MRILFRFLLVVLVALVVLIVIGPMMPQGSLFHDMSHAVARALHLSWLGPFGVTLVR
jgi:hypothetical protein